MNKILIVEDDDFIRQLTKCKLEAEGYDVVEAKDKASLLKQLDKHELHTILLDIMLNKDNGIELIKEIKRYTNAPIIVISSKDHLFDKIIALEMGADDYMCKPVESKELFSRIKAHIRRYLGSGANDTQPTDSKEIKFGSWIIDHPSYSIKNKNGNCAGLTKDEYDLVATLARAPHVVFTRDQLFDILKADNYQSFDRAVDIQVARIRKKLGDDANNPSIIKTIRKVGYQFIAPIKKIEP